MLVFFPSKPFGFLCDGFNVMHDGRIIGKINSDGHFHLLFRANLTEDEKRALEEMKLKVKQMPSQFGFIDVE